MTRRLAVAAVAMTVTLQAAPAKLTGEETQRLLERVGERYRQMTEYDVEVTITSEAGWPGMSARTEYRLAAAAPARFHLLRRDSGRGKWWKVVSDGQTVWMADEEKKSYSATALREASGALLQSRGTRWFADRHIRYKERFNLLAKREQKPPKFEEWEELEMGGVKTRCAVIRTESRESAPKLYWAETLWIDVERALVVRSRRRHEGDRASGQTASEEDVRLRWRRTEGPLEEGLFRFEAPAGFKRE